MASLLRNCIRNYLLKTNVGTHFPCYLRSVNLHRNNTGKDSKSLFKSTVGNPDECQSLKEKERYTVRAMRKCDLPSVFHMLDEEKWIMEKAYLQCAFDIAPKSFYVLTTNNGTIIGCKGLYSTCERMYYSCMWLVKKEYRHTGAGNLLLIIESKVPFNANESTFVWAHLQHDTAAKGFLFKSYMTWYNYGTLRHSINSSDKDNDFEVKYMDDKQLGELIEYDTTIHAMIRRDQYITNWIKHNNSRTVIATKNGKIVGYGVLRSQDNYNQIAPLYADSEKVATAIFEKLTKELPKNYKVGYSCPVDNSAAMALAKRYGLIKPGYPLVLMFTKNIVHIDTSKVYAVSSNSFGLC